MLQMWAVALGSHVILIQWEVVFGCPLAVTASAALLILHMLRVIFFYICYFVNEIYYKEVLLLTVT